MTLPSTSGRRAPWGALLRIAAAVALIAAAWHLAVLAFAIPPYLVPTPLAVLRTLVEQRRVVLDQAGFTIAAAALGLLASTVFATTVAVAFSLKPVIASAAQPLVISLRSAPVAAVAPIILLCLGRGIATSIVVVLIVSFFPLLVSLSRGLATADRTATELLHVYGASRLQQIRYVKAPYALSFLFSGLRVASANAILGAMLSEWITGSRGLGNLILESGDLRETELLWAAILVSVLIALLTFAGTSILERRVLRWRRPAHG